MIQTVTERMFATQTDPKARAVLRASFEAFLQIGLKRTSMQDIADSARLSRAAIYQVFRNKDDIYGTLMAAYFAMQAEDVSGALAAHDDPTRALIAAFEAQLGDAEEAMLRSPNGAEVRTVGTPATAAILVDGQAALVRVYARWLDENAVAGRIAPEALAGNSARTARIMLAGLEGLAGLSGDWPAYLDARRHLAQFQARALSPRP